MVLPASVIHFAGDFLISSFRALGPFFIEHFDITNKTFASSIALIGALTAFLQLIFGAFFDKRKKDGLYMTVFVVIEFLLFTLLGFVNTFIVLLIFIFLMRIANSGFHPIGASIAGMSNKDSHLAYFDIAGMIGATAGPVFVTMFVANFGFENIYWLGLASLALVPTYTFKLWKFEKKTTAKRLIPRKKELVLLIPILTVATVRGFVNDIFKTYIPIFLNEKTASLVIGGASLSFGMIVGMFTNVIGTKLRKHIGIKFVNFIGFLGMGITGLLFLMIPGTIIKVIMASLFGGFSHFHLSTNAVEAQSRLPKNRGFATSVAKGVAKSLALTISSSFAVIFGNNVEFMILSVSIVGLTMSAFILIKKSFLKTY